MASDTILSHDPTAGTAVHDLDDRFIPIRAPELVRALTTDHELLGEDTGWLPELHAAFADLLDRETSALTRLVSEQYVPFSPDRDTYSLHDIDRDRTPDAYAALDRSLTYLLEKANFERLSDVQIDAAIYTANSFGLRVRLYPERIQSLQIWVRGRAMLDRRIRSWRHPFRGKWWRLEVCRRVVVITRLRKDPYIHVKIFKDIPTADLEALMPHADVRMNWYDRLTVFSGGAGALGTTATKVFGILTTVVALGQLLWVLLVGCVMLTIRTILGYRRARLSRDSQRTRHLYYQNLSNNLAAVSALVSMIAQEEEKEAVLAYTMCYAATRPVRSVDELAKQVNAYIRQRFALAVDFDAPDAVKTLRKLELWQDESKFRVVPPTEAITRLGGRPFVPQGLYQTLISAAAPSASVWSPDAPAPA